MADPITDALISLAQAFSLTKTLLSGGLGPPSPYSLKFELLSPAGERGQLSVVENVVETVIQNAPIDLSFLLKDVRFGTAPITDGIPVGGQPILNILTPGLTETEQPPLPINGPGVAGAVAALTGSLPIPVQQTVAKPLDVTFDVQWTVLDENGNVANDEKWSLDATQQGQGGTIPIQSGQTLLPLRVDFLPPILELTPNTPLTINRTIVVSLRLTATSGGAFRATSGWVNLPAVVVPLPVVQVPTIAIFFSSKFGGDTLVAVPSSSILEESTFNSEMFQKLDTLRSQAVGTVSSVLTVGAFFIGVLDPIKDFFQNDVTNLKFKKADSMDLHDVEFAGASWTDWNGEDGDDHFVSMMLIGPPNRAIDCFNEDDFTPGEGQMRVSVDNDLIAQVEDLGSANPTSLPPGHVAVPHAPDGYNVWQFRSITSFKNELSSYRFTWV